MSTDRFSPITDAQIAPNAKIASSKLALNYTSAADFKFDDNIVKRTSDLLYIDHDDLRKETSLDCKNNEWTRSTCIYKDILFI